MNSTFLLQHFEVKGYSTPLLGGFFVVTDLVCVLFVCFYVYRRSLGTLKKVKIFQANG